MIVFLFRSKGWSVRRERSLLHGRIAHYKQVHASWMAFKLLMLFLLSTAINTDALSMNRNKVGVVAISPEDVQHPGVNSIQNENNPPTTDKPTDKPSCGVYEKLACSNKRRAHTCVDLLKTKAIAFYNKNAGRTRLPAANLPMSGNCSNLCTCKYPLYRGENGRCDRAKTCKSSIKTVLLSKQNCRVSEVGERESSTEKCYYIEGYAASSLHNRSFHLSLVKHLWKHLKHQSPKSACQLKRKERYTICMAKELNFHRCCRATVVQVRCDQSSPFRGFKAKQCSSKECWCVYENGDEIDGSRQHRSLSSKDCLRVRKEVLATKRLGVKWSPAD